MLKKITLSDFLSYGPGATDLELRPLNVLIGPNGSGKSNLVEAFAVLRAVPRDLPLPIRQGGGVEEWLWQSAKSRATEASIEVIFRAGVATNRNKPLPVRYRLRFGSEGDSFVVLDERIENETGSPKPYFYFGYESGKAMINAAGDQKRQLERANIDPTQSILSQRRDPENYPEVTAVGDLLKKILIYRSWRFGPDAAVRAACRPDVQTDRLLEDFSNLPARLAVLKRNPATKRRMLELLEDFAPGYTDIEVAPEGGRLQLYLTDGDRNVPAHRLSDGTLRYLTLLAILLDPGAARLIVVEEPELGLHPDVFPTLRDLLVEASQNVQLVVTTHSTQLVDAMTDHAGSVVVCEKEGPTSVLHRLSQDDVDRWRQFGALGNLWMSGRVGGTRW